MRTALTIAGSDSCGGAGIQADLKTMTMNGVFAMSAVTALTAQNTTGVTGIMEVTPDFLGQQIDAVFTDIRPDAVKIGMVASEGLIARIAERLRFYKAENIVVDPVMVATSGARLIADGAVEALKRELLPLAALLTPNIPEAEVLSEMKISDPNYDLFKLACRVSAKRLFPNFSFIDAPYNLQYYKPGNPDTEIAYMGCRTRVIGNNYDPSREIVTGRGNLSFTSINLPRLAIKADHNVGAFFESLDAMMDLAIDQLMHRFKIQAQKRVRNYPFLMGQGIWIDSDKLSPDDTVEEVLKHGTLSVGFIGLAETLKALIGAHHGESEEARELGLEIVGTMRKRLDEEAKRTGLNFSLLATPAEGLSGRFVRMDAKKYGVIEGVTDREYYTNSFHVPVYYPISAFEKIRIEAPYHELTNAGHISYIELDGDPLENLNAFEKIVRCMKESGIGYGAINHPVDRDPCCGYTGIIGDTCPCCGRKEHTDNVAFDRIRRITGYLVGTLDRFNNGKRAEEHDRVKHQV